MIVPPRFPNKPDPEDIIREIEEDPLTEIVWSLPAAIRTVRRSLARLVRHIPAVPDQPQTVECPEGRV